MAKTRVTQDLKYKNAKLFKESLSVAGSTYIAVSRFSEWETGVTPAVYGSVKERNEFEYELLGMQNVPAADVHYMIKRVTWTSGEVYDMYRHDYTDENRSYSGAFRLEDSRYVVYTTKGDVYICLDNAGGAPSTVSPASTLTVPFTTTDGYQWVKAYTLTSTQRTNYSSGGFIPVIQDNTKKNTVAGAVYTVVLESGGSGYTTSPVGGINQIPYYYCNVLGDGTGAVARIQVVGTRVTSVDIVRNGQDYTYATIKFDSTSSYASVEDLDAQQNRLNPEGTGFEATVIIQPEGGFGENLFTDVSVEAVGVFGNLSYTTLDKIQEGKFHQVGLLTNPTFTSIGFSDRGEFPTAANTVKSVAVVSVFGTPSFEVGEIIEQLINDDENSPTARGTIVGIDTGVVIDDDLTVDIIRYVQTPNLHLDVDDNLYEFVGDNNITGVSSNGNAVVQQTVNGFFSLMNFVGGYADSDHVKGSGDLIYLSNLQVVNRTPGQREKVSFVINF